MYGDTQIDVESLSVAKGIGARIDAMGEEPTRSVREPVVRAASLKTAIAQLHDLAKVNAGRSSGQALAANLLLLHDLGVDDEALDLVVEMVLSQNVDEEMTAAVNYLASGFLLALLTFEEEGSSCLFSHA